MDGFAIPASGIATVTEATPELSDLLECISRPAWMANALCQEYPEVNFFPSTRSPKVVQAVERAKAVCERRLCRDECLAWALAADPNLDDGIFGGTTPAERRALRARAAGPADEPAA